LKNCETRSPSVVVPPRLLSGAADGSDEMENA